LGEDNDNVEDDVVEENLFYEDDNDGGPVGMRVVQELLKMQTGNLKRSCNVDISSIVLYPDSRPKKKKIRHHARQLASTERHIGFSNGNVNTHIDIRSDASGDSYTDALALQTTRQKLLVLSVVHLAT
jgi:hypothetical protein